MRYVFPVLMVLAALLACKGKKGEQPAPSASEAVVAPSASQIVAAIDSAAAAPSGSALSDQAAKVPVKEDFEQQAKQTANKDNLTQQIDSIEKEIKSDKE
jgi:uncharacterized membrane-anchored protein